MTICEYIDSVLKEKGISRRKLAISAGISPSSLQSAFERNSKLSLDMLLPIMEVLNLPQGKTLAEFGYSSLLFDFEETIKEITKTKTIDELIQEGEQATAELANEILDNPEAFIMFGNFKILNQTVKHVAIDVVEGLTTISKYREEQKETPPEEEPPEAK